MIFDLASLVNVTREALGLIFVSSSAFKIKRPNAFQTVVFLLSGPFRAFYKGLSKVVLGSELLAGIFLIIGLVPVQTASLTVILMLLFDITLIVLRLGHPGVDCGCFGAGRHHIGIWLLLRNVGMTLASIALLMATRSGGYRWQRPSLPELVVATAAGATVTFLSSRPIALRRHGSA